MKIGFFAVGIGNLAQPELITAAAEHAERLNFSTVWAPEHAVLLDKFDSSYPYSADGELPIATDTPILDPFLALTYAAARTTRIRLATGICLLPEHNPLLVAKTAATLDYLSGGRFVLGVGIGWLKEEFDALGISWERRGGRTVEYMKALRSLWGDEQSCLAGEFVHFENVRSYPKPVNGAKLPILIGGQSEAALRRAAAHADGWCGFNSSPQVATEKINRPRELLAGYGRNPKDFEFAVSPSASDSANDLKCYAEAGVDELYIAPVFGRLRATPKDVVATLEELARDWIEPAARL